MNGKRDVPSSTADERKSLRSLIRGGGRAEGELNSPTIKDIKRKRKMKALPLAATFRWPCDFI